MSRCYACSQENCGYRQPKCSCDCHPENKPKKQPRRYVVLTDPDDPREGEVRLGGKEGDEGWVGGQLICRWDQRINRGGLPPERIQKLVDLANKALDAR
jgi:hypothetical protein